MNLKVPGAILPLGCAILSTRAITVRGGWYNPPLGELGLIIHRNYSGYTYKAPDLLSLLLDCRRRL